METGRFLFKSILHYRFDNEGLSIVLKQALYYNLQVRNDDFPICGTFRSSPAIDSNGDIYLGINTGNASSAFFALKKDGTLKWKFEPADLPVDVPDTHFDIYSSPAIGTGGVVYFGQEFGRVYSLKTSDGSLVEMVNTKSGINWSSPVIDQKGVLYISDLSGTVYAIETGCQGLDISAAWPKFRYDNQNSGRRH